jgi:DNA-binding transcriptional regulator YdaS (Cro superfamily)
MLLKTYLRPMTVEGRAAFATACGSNYYQFLRIAYGNRRATPMLAMAIERQSHGEVTCEEMCPEFDWTYARSRKARSKQKRAA